MGRGVASPDLDWQVMVGIKRTRDAATVGTTEFDGNRQELAEVVKSLENCLVKVDSLGLTLVAALVDHALAEAKRHLAG